MAEEDIRTFQLDDLRFDSQRTVSTGKSFGLVSIKPLRLRAAMKSYKLGSTLDQTAITKDTKRYVHKHPYLAPICGVAFPILPDPTTNGGDQAPKASILYGYFPNNLKSLLEHHVAAPQNFSWRHRARIARELAISIAFLHHHDLLFSNLRSSNVLLTRLGHVKLTDYAFASVKLLSGQLSKMLTGGNGITDLAYSAPEQNDLGNADATTYPKEGDVFAFGVILWELATLNVPWENKSLEFVLAQLRRSNGDNHLPIPGSVPQAWRDCMKQCWATLPSERITMQEFVDKNPLAPLAELKTDIQKMMEIPTLTYNQDVVDLVDEGLQSGNRDMMLLALKLVHFAGTRRQPELEATKLARLFKLGYQVNEETPAPQEPEKDQKEEKKQEKKPEKKEEKKEQNDEKMETDEEEKKEEKKNGDTPYFCQLANRFAQDPEFLESLVLALYRVAEKVSTREKEWMVQYAIATTLQMLAAHPTQTVLAENASGLFEYLTVHVPGCQKLLDGIDPLLRAMESHANSRRLVDHAASTLSNIARFTQFREPLKRTLKLLSELNQTHPNRAGVLNAINNINKIGEFEMLV